MNAVSDMMYNYSAGGVDAEVVAMAIPVTLTPSERWHHTSLTLSLQALVFHS